METEKRPDGIIVGIILALMFVMLTAFAGKKIEGVFYIEKSIFRSEDKYSFRLKEGEYISLRVSGEIPKEGCQVKIEDENGREIWKGCFQGERKEYQIRLKKGKYYVKIPEKNPCFLLWDVHLTIQKTCRWKLLMCIKTCRKYAARVLPGILSHLATEQDREYWISHMQTGLVKKVKSGYFQKAFCVYNGMYT